MTSVEDLEKYPVYVFKDNRLHKVELCDLENMSLPNNDRHHFLRKTIRKNSPNDYERWECYQRMIIMPHQMNLDIETMGEKSFENKWGIPLHVVVFNRDRWRCGFYESKFFTNYYGD